MHKVSNSRPRDLCSPAVTECGYNHSGQNMARRFKKLPAKHCLLTVALTELNNGRIFDILTDTIRY
jgi:hypothetical protein